MAQQPLRRRHWHPTPVLLPGKSHGWRSLVGCSPWGHEESDTTERLHFHFSLSCIGERNGNPLQCSCLENPRDGSLVGCCLWGRPSLQVDSLPAEPQGHNMYIYQIFIVYTLIQCYHQLYLTKIRVYTMTSSTVFISICLLIANDVREVMTWIHRVLRVYCLFRGKYIFSETQT